MRISDWSSDVCSSDLGLPPNEQHFLLVTRTGIPPVYRLDYRARRIRLGRRDRLDALSAAFHERIAWPSCRHGDTFNAPGGSIFHHWGHQFHRHHLQHARDRKSVVAGKNVSERVDVGGRHVTKKKNK